MFEGFEEIQVQVGDEIVVSARVGGTGPAVLLLHGHPQTHLMWHRIAPRLSQSFSVVAADLRGYGGSSKPSAGGGDAELYSKRAMAADQVDLMESIGFRRFAVVGHDRGARCAYRLALDHPDRVERLAVLDIVPTADALRLIDERFAYSYWHWFFLAQPFDLPERMLRADPFAYYQRWVDPPSYFDLEAVQAYRDNVRDPATIHAVCGDYRAGLTLDRDNDERDRGRRRIECPVLALWAGRGELRDWYDVVELWTAWSDDVRGHAVDSGHFMAEEAPEETLGALLPFLSN